MQVVMKTRFILPAFAVLFSAAVATAHTGAQGVVLERMQGMTALADAMKVLAPMVRGQTPHDGAAVAEAGRVFSMHSGQDLIDLFEDENTQAAPSEAGPAIWADPELFEDLAMRLETLGMELGNSAATPDETAMVFAQIGQTCVACHEDYRVKRD